MDRSLFIPSNKSRLINLSLANLANHVSTKFFILQQILHILHEF